MFLDLDHFKEYNDVYGHPAGDDVLVVLSEVIRDEFRRPTDLAIRFGGEEFLIIFESNTLLDAHKKAESLREALIERRIEHKMNKPLEVLTLSAGLLVIDPSVVGDEIDVLIECTDRLLYTAKSEGRNKVVTGDAICRFDPTCKISDACK